MTGHAPTPQAIAAVALDAQHAALEAQRIAYAALDERDRLREALRTVRDELSNGPTANWDLIDKQWEALDALDGDSGAAHKVTLKARWSEELGNHDDRAVCSCGWDSGIVASPEEANAAAEAHDETAHSGSSRPLLDHDARAFLIAFIDQIEAEYHADDLADIAAAVAPVGIGLDRDERDLTTEQLADYLLTGRPGAAT